MARRKPKKHAEEEAGEAWLLPYSDLMTLLLAVFIVLFAVSKIDQAKAEEMSQYFNEYVLAEDAGAGAGAGQGGGGGVSPDYEATNPPPATEIRNDELKLYLGDFEYAKLKDLKAELDVMFINEDKSLIVTQLDKRGLVISLNNAILFPSGSANVMSEHKDTLKDIAVTINKSNNYIRIEGHTDNIPIRSIAYPSNWELSAARASSVVRLFINECNVSPEKVVAVGYGEFKPVGDNSTEEGRASNRRIDIIVLSEKYDNLEQQIVP
jgi:chemotaxis protein MotB